MSPTTTTPTYSAPHNGIIGDASATAGAGQVNQFLGTHGITAIYQGASILTPDGTGGTAWQYNLDVMDVDQPFTMSGTTIGRIAVPVLPVNGGADLLVSLCQDNAGVPGTVIAQTRVPANWISQLGAVAGQSVTGGPEPSTSLTGNPLATAQFNNYHKGLNKVTNWPYPYTTSTAAPSASYYGGYIIQIGGVTGSPAAAISNVFTIPYDTAGTLSPAIPQIQFPTANDGSSATTVVMDAVTGGPVVVNTGGATTFGGSPGSAVYTASLDTTTGALSAWSSQTALPYAVQNHTMASWNGYVYLVGGITGGAVVNTVSYAQVQNGQITAWSAGNPLPFSAQRVYVGASNGFLIVTGGFNINDTVSNLATYYAVINADGSLGPWVGAGPAPLTPPFTGAFWSGISGAPANSGFVTQSEGLQVLSFGPSGPGFWASSTGNGAGLFTGYADLGNGSVRYYGLQATYYNGFTFDLAPYISVPLPVTGLTNGATYHVLLQQQGGSATSYLCTCDDAKMFPGTPTGQTSARGAYAWTPVALEHGVPFQIFDQSVVSGQVPYHLWADNGARMTTIVSASTPDQRILGVCEATRQAYAQNTNTGFETGIAPWTCTGGTVAQSSTQVFEGSFSAQVTPSGSASSVVLASELLPCMPGQPITAHGRLWFTNAVTNAASVSVAWFDLTGAPVSTSSTNVSVPAATWTELSNPYTAPAGAYQYSVEATLSGTPSSSQVFYVDAARGYPTYAGPQNSTVAQIEYAETWPAIAGVPVGAGTVQLA